MPAKRSPWSNLKSPLIPLSALGVLTINGAALADPIDDLVAAAKNEGQLTVIALPRD